MGNIVTCIKRIYNIQMPNGIKMDVESEKPLSDATTAKLLEDDSEIGIFLENIKILDINIPQEKMVAHSNKKLKKRAKLKIEKRSKLKIEKRSKLKREKRDLLEKKTGDNDRSVNRLNPPDRVNMMITMGGEFTRIDYQKFMEDKGYKMSDFMGYGDIEDALMLKRIVPTGEKIGKGRKKYRIIDVMPVEQYTYKKMLKIHRNKMKY